MARPGESTGCEGVSAARRSWYRRGMNRLALSVPVFSFLVVAACGGPAEQAPAIAPTSTGAPTVSGAATGTGAASAGASAAATSTAASTAAASTAAASAGRPGKPTVRFWDYDGPAEGPAITGARGWTAVPTGAASDRYRHVFISVEDFVKTAGGENHWRTPSNDLVVPIAMGANLAAPAALKKGDPILAENSNDSAVARVLSVEGETVKAKYVFGDLVGDLEVARSEVLLLDGTLRLGTPVAFKRSDRWYVGKLIAKSATDAWVALHYTDNEPYAKVKAADVRAIDVKKVLAVGDKCVADSSYASKNELWPAKVTKVIEDGLFYEVKTDKGQAWTVPFDHVSAPL